MQIKCTSCGATQELTADQKCGYCGSAIEQEKAQENYKTSTTGETGNLMMMAETAIDATNWEEALQYYNKTLEKNITNSDAWLGKGIAIVYTSKIGDIKTTEAIAYWKNAIKHAENTVAMGKRVAKEINSVVNSFYPAIENHYIQFNELDNAYSELVSRFGILEHALDYATQIDKEEIKISETGYELCKKVIKLPRIYASESKSAAQLAGTLGQFTSNKYAAERARKDSMEKVRAANERLKEISKASKVVNQIQKKYVEIIKNINPNHYCINELLIQEKIIEEEAEKEALKKRQNVYIISIIIGVFLGYSLGNFIGLKINEMGFMFGNLTKFWLILWVALGGYLGYLFTRSHYSKNVDKSESNKLKKNSINLDLEDDSNKQNTISIDSKSEDKSNNKRINKVVVIVIGTILISAIIWLLVDRQKNKNEIQQSTEVENKPSIDEEIVNTSLQNSKYGNESYEEENEDNSTNVDDSSEINSPETNPRDYHKAIIVISKTYFYETPSYEMKRKAFLIEGDSIEFTNEENGFLNATFTNSSGKSTSGWISKNDVEFVEEPK